ncbi:aminoglycoside phosphotransferase family protein [Halobacillus andaensis]|uniref:aminoglycoside phosphotransferase family protein n=1 Tax=Halobacillus andaensis TaxID=1176239 RepID=UPI003D7220DD
MKLPEKFVNNVLAACPEDGQEWLDSLPELVSYCEKRWSLTIEHPFSLSYNFVAPATARSGEKVVVKISLPEEGYEREGLMALNPEGRINIVDEDKEKRILLLERVDPGNPLSEMNNDEEATYTAAHVMKNIISSPAPDSPLPSTRLREQQLRKLYLGCNAYLGPISKRTLKLALEVFTYLNDTARKRKVLHGDFHHYNILQKGDGEWTAIDPKGLIGEVEYDLVQFLLNRLPDHNRQDCIRKRVDIFVEELQLSKERLLLFGFCHSVLAASWTVDQRTGHYDEVFYSGIDTFQRLYENTYHQSIDIYRKRGRSNGEKSSNT